MSVCLYIFDYAKTTGFAYRRFDFFTFPSDRRHHPTSLRSCIFLITKYLLLWLLKDNFYYVSKDGKVL